MNEVEELTVRATQGYFYMEDSENGKNDLLPRLFGTPPYPLAFDATAAEVQTVLEDFYGSANVTVSEVSGQPADTHAWKIKFAGGLSGRPIQPLKAESDFYVELFEPPATGLKVETGPGEFEAGSASAQQITEGSFHGSQIVVQAANLGDAAANGGCVEVAAGIGKYSNSECTEEAAPGTGEFEKHTISISDTLPEGLEAARVEAAAGISLTDEEGLEPRPECAIMTPRTVECTFKGTLPAYALIEVDVGVIVTEAARTGEQNEASVSGGEGRSASVARPITASDAPTPFGVQDYELTPEEEGGTADTQAGSHPFQVTGTLTLNQTAEAEPAQLPKDMFGKLPPGLIGNPTVFRKCTLQQFFAQTCAPQSVLGIAMVTFREPLIFPQLGSVGTFTLPIVNLEPSEGEAARFGFLLPGIAPIFLSATVRTGGNYGVDVGSSDISQISGFLGFHLVFWGVPGEAAHNSARGGPVEESEPPPFLAMPTSCTTPMETSIEGDPWIHPGAFQEFPGEPMPAMDGCNRLTFSPEIKVKPDVEAASSSSGLSVDVHVPQNSILSAHSLAESAVKDIQVTLPEGVMVNPSGGNGLAACSESLVGFTGFKEFEPATEPGSRTATFTPKLPEPLNPGVNFCANASKIATAEIVSPLLPPEQHLQGAVYLATQNENPFGSLIALYIVAEDPISKTLVKLAGETHLTESGQIVTTFENNPQLAFENAELHFFGGERAPLSTPARCGAYTTNATFTPWSAERSDEAAVKVSSSSTFNITSGPNGTACPGSLPFSPSLTGGMLNINAGSFSALSTTIGREDGNQDLQSVQLHLPAGLEGVLTGVKLCPEEQANAGTCSAESEIGETTVSAGVGSDPVTVKGGKVYLTGEYEGAPFGLSIVNPVKAGPFDLEHDTSNPNQQPPCDCVVVRAKIEVNPYTAELTVTTNSSGAHAIPHMIDGVPVQIKHVNVTVNRPNFTFNPTNCNPMAITGTLGSDEGASQALSVPFQATNCAILGFAPKFAVSTSGKTSKVDGASLSVKLSYPTAPFGSQTNIAKTKVDLPKQLPSRLTTLNKACLAAVFEETPASPGANCRHESEVGHVKVITPVLPVPLEGPAYFVSHGNEAFPSLTMVLKGYGITVVLVGSTFIRNGITSTTFKATPDVPFNTFELTLPEGKYSALAANGDLCTSKLAMPTAFVGQNGAEIHESTPISVTGCPKPLTTAQKLAQALKACRKKANHKKRAACEQLARKRYPVKASKKAKGKKK